MIFNFWSTIRISLRLLESRFAISSARIFGQGNVIEVREQLLSLAIKEIQAVAGGIQ
jgi:hypothetical protein